MKKSKLKGFTLIELLVVIAIIGILAAIVYSPIQTSLRKGRDAKKVSEMKTLQSDLMLYSDSHNGAYPATLADLDAATNGGIPKNYNTTTTYDPNKYNYTSYKDNSGMVKGYHLYVHLETSNAALQGAASCQGYATTYSTSTCYVTSQTSAAQGVGEPNNGAGGAFFTDHSQDSDTQCSGDTTKCIYDIKG